MTAPAATHRSRRGRPRSTVPATASPLEPREEILRHAARLFSERGIAGTRLADIASAVGVTAPAIYYHFENLDSILHALLDYVVGDSAAFATAAADRPGPCSDRMAALIAHHIERLTAGPYDLWFVAGLSAQESRRFPDVSRHANRWRKAVARLVGEGVDAGEFRAVEPQLAVAALSGLVYGAMLLRHDDGRIDPAEVARMAVGALSR